MQQLENFINTFSLQGFLDEAKPPMLAGRMVRHFGMLRA
jgi:hypothetical protein